MGTNHAEEYAESVAAGIAADCAAGRPWGEDSDDCPDPYEYLTECLDVNYVANSRGEYVGAEIALTLGGPNAWVHTRARELHVWWGGDHAVRDLPAEYCDGLDAAAEQLFELVR